MRASFSSIFVALILAWLLLGGCRAGGPAHAEPVREAPPATVLATDLYDAENLTFDCEGRLFVSAADHIWLVTPEAGRPGCYRTSPLPVPKAIYAGMAIGPDRCLYAVCYSGWKTKILRIDITRADFPCSVYLEGRILSPNGLRFDDEGVLYVADFGMYLPWKGAIWRISQNPDDVTVAGEAEKLASGLRGPNGIAIDRDRGRLYFTCTMTGKIYYLRKVDDGFDPHPELFFNASLPGPRFPILDDLALDETGNLYVCNYNGDRILAVSPEGDLLREIAPAGIRHPTAIAFGRAAGDETSLYLTQKGHMFFREHRSGDRVCRVAGGARPYRLPFLEVP
jgi:hypothetical protein